MGNLLSVPKQSAYQERLVDWEADYIQPGATLTQNQIARMQYFNRYQYPNQSSQTSAVGLQNLGSQSQQGFCLAPTSRTMLRQGVNQSNLAMCPIDELPIDEEYNRSERCWMNNRQIPIIQEPNQMFLTIPSHVERYPAYPVRKKIQPQNPVIPQYGYYNNDKTELIFPTKNQSQDSLCSNEIDQSYIKSEKIKRRTTSLDSEPSIPYIDQSDEGLELSSQSQESIFSEEQLDDSFSDGNHHHHHTSCKMKDRADLQINLSTDQYKAKTCSKSSFLHVDNCSPESNFKVDNKPMIKSVAIIHQTPLTVEAGSHMLQKKDSYSCDKLHFSKQSNSGQKIEAKIVTAPIEVTYVPTVEENKVEFENVHSNETHNGSSASDSTDNGEAVEIGKRNTIPTPKMHTIMPELNLDLSGLNSDVSSEDSNTGKCWKSPEEVRLGCGRVAALAKHFSKLGSAGIIKFKSKQLLSSRQFVSEPDIASPRSPEITVRKNSNCKQFKSEADLLMQDKFNVTSTEKEWDMILLDIQDDNDLGGDRGVNATNEDNDAPGELIKTESKLSLAEQQEIIEQLKEFSNLDNVDAPLYIPESIKIHEIKIEVENKPEDSDQCVITESETTSTYNSSENIIDSQNFQVISSSHTHYCGGKSAVPTVLSTLNISPGFELTKKINKLEKYWSLKDLVSTSNSEPYGTEYTDGSPKYFIFPSRSRVASAPDILNENLAFFDIRPLLSKFRSEVIRNESTVSISEEIGHEERPAKLENLSPKSKSLDNLYKDRTVETELKVEKSANDLGPHRPGLPTKFPESFIRMKKKSTSCDEVSVNSDSSNVSGTALRKAPASRSCGNISTGLSNPESRINKAQLAQRSGNPGRVMLTKIVARSCDVPLSMGPNRIVKRDSSKVLKPAMMKPMMVEKKFNSDLDISMQKPTPRFERGDWIFREFPPLESESETRKPADMKYFRYVLTITLPGSVRNLIL